MPRPLFSASQQKTVQALALRLFAPHSKEAVDPARIEVGALVSEYLTDLDPLLCFGMKALVTAFNWLPLLVIGRFSTFRNLATTDQDYYIRFFTESHVMPIRMAFTGLRIMMAQVFFEQDPLLTETGWGVNLVRSGEAPR